MFVQNITSNEVLYTSNWKIVCPPCVEVVGGGNVPPPPPPHHILRPCVHYYPPTYLILES